MLNYCQTILTLVEIKSYVKVCWILVAIFFLLKPRNHLSMHVLMHSILYLLRYSLVRPHHMIHVIKSSSYVTMLWYFLKLLYQWYFIILYCLISVWILPCQFFFNFVVENIVQWIVLFVKQCNKYVYAL